MRREELFLRARHGVDQRRLGVVKRVCRGGSLFGKIDEKKRTRPLAHWPEKLRNRVLDDHGRQHRADHGNAAEFAEFGDRRHAGRRIRNLNGREFLRGRVGQKCRAERGKYEQFLHFLSFECGWLG